MDLYMKVSNGDTPSRIREEVRGATLALTSIAKMATRLYRSDFPKDSNTILMELSFPGQSGDESESILLFFTNGKLSGFSPSRFHPDNYDRSRSREEWEGHIMPLREVEDTN